MDKLSRDFSHPTANLKAGYLRDNGMPYSESAVVTEYFDLSTQGNGDQLMVVTTVVEGSKYLQQPFIVISQVKKQADARGWDGARVVHVVATMKTIRRVKTGLALVRLTAAMTIVTSRTVWAQAELSGSWAARNHADALKRGLGPYALEYTGLPINNEARLKALSYRPHRCR